MTCTKIFESSAMEVPEMAEQILSVSTTKKPICIAVDGICLSDDIGGIHGFVDLLEDLHGKDADAAEAAKAWAKGIGWTGRTVKPPSML